MMTDEYYTLVLNNVRDTILAYLTERRFRTGCQSVFGHQLILSQEYNFETHSWKKPIPCNCDKSIFYEEWVVYP